MAFSSNHDARNHEFEEVGQGVEPGAQHLAMADLHDVPLHVTVDLGGCTMRVRDILALKPGSIVPLDKLAGEMTDVCINDLPLAKGEVMVIGDELKVRLGEVIANIEEGNP